MNVIVSMMVPFLSVVMDDAVSESSCSLSSLVLKKKDTWRMMGAGLAKILHLSNYLSLQCEGCD